MASTAELKQKEVEAFQKISKDHQAKMKKLDDAAQKNVLKILKKIKFFDVDLSDEELSAGFKKMLEHSGKVAAVIPSTELTGDPENSSQPDVSTS